MDISCRYGRKSKVRGKVVRIGRLGGVLDGFRIIVKSNQNPHSIWERLLIPPQTLRHGQNLIANLNGALFMKKLILDCKNRVEV